MPLILKIMITISFIMFSAIMLGFIIAGIMDLINSRRRKKDLFYQLSRDYNERKRPAAK